MSDNVFGLPVKGEPQLGNTSDQHPIEELAPIFQALLDDPNVHSFGWTQYTPYWNDGDVCEFSVGDPWIKTVDDVDREIDDWYDLRVHNSEHPTLGDHDNVMRELTSEEIQAEHARQIRAGYVRPYVSTYTWDRIERTPKYPETLQRAKKLTEIQDGKYEWAMKQKFGDHAMVTVTRDAITIDEYEHD